MQKLVAGFAVCLLPILACGPVRSARITDPSLELTKMPNHNAGLQISPATACLHLDVDSRHETPRIVGRNACADPLLVDARWVGPPRTSTEPVALDPGPVELAIRPERCSRRNQGLRTKMAVTCDVAATLAGEPIALSFDYD